MLRPRWWVQGAAVLLTVAMLAMIDTRLMPATALVSAQLVPPSSPGCTALNDPSFDATYATSSGSETFQAGDVITIGAGPPTNGPTPTMISLYVDDVVVETTPFPGAITYTFPAGSTGYHSVAWMSDVGNVTWMVSCNPAPDTTAPELRISIDPTTKEVRVDGVDDGDGVATPNPIAPTTCTTVRTGQVCLYRATDLSGNSVTATLQITRQSGQTQVVVQRLQYSGQAATTPLSNSLVASFAPASGTPSQFNQTASVVAPGTPATVHKVTANWTAASGRTTITPVTPPGPVDSCGGSNPTPLALQTQAGALQIRVLCLV